MNTQRIPLLSLWVVLAACTATTTHPGSAGEAGPATTTPPEDSKLVWSERAYPTGRMETSAVLVRRGMPESIQRGQRYQYEIRVRNLTELAVTNVVLTDTAPPQFQVAEGIPAAKVEGGRAIWELGEIEGDQTVILRASALAAEAGGYRHVCQVRWEAPLVGQTTVTLPRLVLTRSAPEMVVLVDGVTLTYEIANEGTGVAREVRIVETLPQGLTTREGESEVSIEVGDLPAGETKQYSVACKAESTGVIEGSAKATGFGGLETASASGTVRVTRPDLELTARAPERAAIGQVVSQEYTVANRGDGPCRDLVLELTLPDGTEFVEATDGGLLIDQSIRWKLGTLDAGADRLVTLRLRAKNAMLCASDAKASGHGAAEVTSFLQTKLYGIATVALDVSDSADPVEIGQEVTYVVTLGNQGTAPGTNLWLICHLEKGMAFVSASGATEAKAEGPKVSFAPVESLAPEATLSWTVVVKAESPGDLRFRVELTGDQFERPVESTEATKFFR